MEPARCRKHLPTLQRPTVPGLPRPYNTTSSARLPEQEVFLTPEYLAIVMEFAQGGNVSLLARLAAGGWAAVARAAEAAGSRGCS